jgi:ABC-2 type transport system ATP-binding protein
MIARNLRRPRVLAAVLVVLVLIVITGVALAGRSGPVNTRSQFLAGTAEPGSSAPVRLDTTLYLPAHTPAPAVLLAHGLGGTKDSVAAEARTLAQHGYVVLAYTARGFGRSGGLVHLDSPDFEVRDASGLVSYLAGLPQVRRVDGKPQIAVAGASYGGGLALLLAGSDPRIEAVGADITWNDLSTALFPNGVFKRMWAGLLFASGSGFTGTSCGRFAADLCAAYQSAAQTGLETPAMATLLDASSPSSVLSRITAPVLLTQGEQDSLFPLSEADANARGIAAHGTPVRVVWRQGGHDTGGGGDVALSALLGFLGDVFAGRMHGTQPFQVAQQGSALSAETGRTVDQVLRAPSYPFTSWPTGATVIVGGPPQPINAPAGGTPAAVTSIPGAGSLLAAASALGGAAAVGVSAIPGQVAAFESGRLGQRTLLAGSAAVPLTVTSASTDATLFVALRDVAPGALPSLPSGLVTPVRLTGLRPGVPRQVTVRLPWVVVSIPSGHSVAITVSTTDLGYAMPADARQYVVGLAGNSATIALPTVQGEVIRSGHPMAWLVVGVLAMLAVAFAVALVLRRRRRAGADIAELAAVPVSVTDLVKKYSDGYKAVDGVSFRVETGQVIGLLGPNGAGKTTVLRTLVGLITPSSGAIHVFGQPILPGAAVLARVGAFIEGPGFLPHLTGRENLRIFWAATGRREADAEFETALDIAGLGASIDRRVKSYSHGMKQRLGIAQAMLGLPELLVLDEPTNGLDPPQIAEMREVMQRYAQTGRTVLVSSHLLAEVEQTCTHVVVMHRGRLVAAGSVAEIAGSAARQLAVADPDRAIDVLAAAGIGATAVPARRALEDVFLELVGDSGE